MVKNKKDNKKFRIGVNVRFLLQGKLEGIGWYTHEIFSRLVSLMPDITFVFFFDRPFDQQFIFGDNVETKVVNPPARHPLLWYIWFEKTLPKAIESENIDVFISPDGYMPGKLKVPSLLTIHDLAFEHYKNHIPWLVWKYYTHYTPIFTQRATKIIAVSKATATDLKEKYHIPDNKISVIYNGCSTSFKPIVNARKATIRETYTDGRPYFIFIGAFHPRKNIEGILQAFDIFRQKCKTAHKLVLVGRMAWETHSIKHTFQAMQFKEEVVFIGSAGRDLLNDLLGGAEALLYPSFLEGFGLPLVEAMYCEVPIITSNVSCMPEVAGKAALLVNPTSIEEIAQAMQTIAENKNAGQALVEEGKKIRNRFNWDDAALKWKDEIWALLTEIQC